MKKVFALILVPFYVLLYGQGDTTVVHIIKLDQPIKFDGWVEDWEWSLVPVFDLRTQFPRLDEAPSERTEVRLAYDDDFLYLSGRMFDLEPHLIMANTKKRDALTGATEYFGMLLDTYNDNKNALAFFTTPTGLRWDAAVSNDALGNNPLNMDWNAFWDVQVQRNEEGWFVEMRVPFSSLAFEQKEEVIMGFTTWRYIARKNEVDIFPVIPPDYGDFSSFRPSLSKDVSFTGIRSEKPFYLTPYALTGQTLINDLDEDEDAYMKTTDVVTEVGGDIKYGISKNWTLDLSFNTDFAQVEADDQQVNLTRFSLFFPEKRLFFQERAGIFYYNFGRSDQLFYSRRIGINEDGEAQRILGGARIVGRSGLWDIGFLSMHTADDGDFKGENLSVLRARRDIINENSDIGMIVTNQMDFEGQYNTTYGLDLNVRLWKDQFLAIRWAQTLSDESEYSLFSMQHSRAWISLSSRNQRGFSYGTSISRAGKDFNPSLGFERRDNYTRFGNRLQYSWFTDDNPKIFSHGFDSGGSIHWSNETGKIESLNWRLGWSLTTTNGMNVQFRARPNVENLNEDFDLSDDVTIPVGDYDFTSFSIEANTPPALRASALLSMETGQFYDGTRTSISIDPTLNLSSSLELGGSYQYNVANFKLRNQKFQVHLVRLKSLIMFSTKLSVAALLQYNSLDKNFLGNIRFRYNPSEGNDLYVVWNDDVNVDRFRESPHLPMRNQRAILVKYSYTFRL